MLQVRGVGALSMQCRAGRRRLYYGFQEVLDRRNVCRGVDRGRGPRAFNEEV